MGIARLRDVLHVLRKRELFATFSSLVVSVWPARLNFFRGSVYPQGYNLTGGSINYKQCGDLCASGSKSTVWVGYLGAIIAILFFGSNYVPVKKLDTGNGTRSLSPLPSLSFPFSPDPHPPFLPPSLPSSVPPSLPPLTSSSSFLFSFSTHTHTHTRAH